jgi:Rieske Fe-S protein
VAPSITTLKAGDGGLVKVGSETVGAYLDLNGKYHIVTPICTHLGCHVLFNHTDKVYDCPCHGSQYDIDGKVIHGPAVKNLCKREDLKW